MRKQKAGALIKWEYLNLTFSLKKLMEPQSTRKSQQNSKLIENQRNQNRPQKDSKRDVELQVPEYNSHVASIFSKAMLLWRLASKAAS